MNGMEGVAEGEGEGSYHLGPEEDGLAEDDDGSGLVERARDGGSGVRPRGVGAEPEEVGVGHGALAGRPHPRARRLHLRGAQHLPRLRHREAPHLRPDVLSRRSRRCGRDEAVEVDAREGDAEVVADPVGPMLGSSQDHKT